MEKERRLVAAGEAVDLDGGDALLTEADGNRRLTDRKPRQLVGSNEKRLSITEKPPYERAGSPETDLTHNLGAGAGAECARNHVGVFWGTDLVDDQDSSTEQCFAEDGGVTGKLLGRNDHGQARFACLKE